MRAIHLSVYGNPVEGLGMVEVPKPKGPGANEVLVAIEYSPLNPNDLLVAKGRLSASSEASVGHRQ